MYKLSIQIIAPLFQSALSKYLQEICLLLITLQNKVYVWTMRDKYVLMGHTPNHTPPHRVLFCVGTYVHKRELEKPVNI